MRGATDAAVMDWELAEFISMLIIRVGAKRSWEHARSVLSREPWPKHPIMSYAIDILDNA